MIIARMDGGLGNQMFQYAFGLWLARQNRTELQLDLGSYRNQPQHGFLLDRFCITASEVDQLTARFVPPRYRNSEGPNGLKQRLAASLWRRPFKRVKQSPFGFHSRYLKTKSNSYLVGYWQSEQFFPGMRERLLSEFQLKGKLSPASQSIERQMLNCNSLALHVRRGDYIKNPANQSIYESMSLRYYQDAIDAFCKQRGQAELFVFSNDVEWCRKNLRCSLRTHYVDHNNADTAHEDLVLMSRAQGCVIANSTFSWWAAWLNSNEKPLILAPSRWFCQGVLDDSDIIPRNWVRVDLDHASAIPHAA